MPSFITYLLQVLEPHSWMTFEADGRNSAWTLLSAPPPGFGCAVVSGLGWSATGRMILGGENTRTSMLLVGELCCVRVYSRPLTASELAHNAAIDTIRYGTSP